MENTKELKGMLSEEVPAQTAPKPARRNRDVLKAKGLLAAQKKESIFIPIDQLNPKDKALYAAINGYGFNIPKGREVEVPTSIAAMLRERGIIG